MKKLSILKTLLIIIGIFSLSVAVIRCTKTGVLAKQLNRSLNANPDAGVLGSFYDTMLTATHDVVPDVNDTILNRGVRTIIRENCASGNCHGGKYSPTLWNYADIVKYVVPGDPQGSKLFEVITTDDFDRAMPPVTVNHELSLTDKTVIYNWILNGANEHPTILDFKPAAVAIMQIGCGSANCHNQATATGAWARKGLFPVTTTDTIFYTYTKPTGAQSFYCLLTNATIRDQVWTAYKDSVKKFYSDTLAYASFRPYKTFTTPQSAYSTRGPLNNYDDILMDVMYPKSVRSSSTGPKGNYLNSNDCLIRQIDSTLVFYNPYTNAPASVSGRMSYDDGGLKPHEIALIKAWYFTDPNIPDVWKYGSTNTGIFKHRKSGTFITR